MCRSRQSFKNDQPLVEDGRVQVNNEHNEKYELIINNVNHNDADRYSCVATNPLGRGTTSMNVSITSNLRPYISYASTTKVM